MLAAELMQRLMAFKVSTPRPATVIVVVFVFLLGDRHGESGLLGPRFGGRKLASFDLLLVFGSG